MVRLVRKRRPVDIRFGLLNGSSGVIPRLTLILEHEFIGILDSAGSKAENDKPGGMFVSLFASVW